MGDPPLDPAREYGDRLRRHERRAAEMERRHQRIADFRLFLFAAFLTLLVLSLGFKLLSLWFCAVPVVAFVPAAFVHDGVLRARQRARRAAAYYRQGLGRLADTWPGTGPAGDRFLDPAHPYAADLDLFGTGSLFQLLCQARTPSGEECLARWLPSPRRSAAPPFGRR